MLFLALFCAFLMFAIGLGQHWVRVAQRGRKPFRESMDLLEQTSVRRKLAYGDQPFAPTDTNEFRQDNENPYSPPPTL
ncbi:MAG: hypothetical protein KDA59_05705 [Planctomycetales bacterium]|nr:hypothetical protein [Planctomycetales bacterium]